jgi:hypothetical protein
VYNFVKFSFKGHVGFKGKGYLSWRKRVSVYPSVDIEVGFIKTEKIGAPTGNAGICSAPLAIYFIKHTSTTGILMNNTNFDILSNDEAVGKGVTSDSDSRILEAV